MRSKLYGQLHGNYMFKVTMNYHELSINSMRSKLYGQLHGNYMLKKETRITTN